MAHHAEYAVEGFTDQSAHPGLDCYLGCTELSVWNDEWYLISFTPMVQTQGWPSRLDSDFPYLTLAGCL